MILYFLANATAYCQPLICDLMKHTNYYNLLINLVDSPKVKIDHLKVIIWNIQNLARNEMINEDMLLNIVYVCKATLDVKDESIKTDSLTTLSLLSKSGND